MTLNQVAVIIFIIIVLFLLLMRKKEQFRGTYISRLRTIPHKVPQKLPFFHVKAFNPDLRYLYYLDFTQPYNVCRGNCLNSTHPINCMAGCEYYKFQDN